VRIALSPGHGLYWNETYAAWYWQRLEWFGIREDTLNSEIMRYVQKALLNQGATVIQLRQMDPYAGYGVSGFPKWYEGSRQYAISLGLPSSIYDGGSTNYNSDIRARPYMANYYDADILISLHNNGYEYATLTGTETYYDNDNHAGSPVLAQYVHNKIINTIRSRYDPDWTNRGYKISFDAYGEINYAEMPAILIELAFMDRYDPDNLYLHDENFKILAAEAIVGGICDFRGVYCPNISITPSDLDNHYYFPTIMQ
jgi:N-acetylmuramoyl-L-alanine amidase